MFIQVLYPFLVVFFFLLFSCVSSVFWILDSYQIYYIWYIYLVWYMISGIPDTWFIHDIYMIYIWYLVYQIHDIFHGVGSLLTFLILSFVAQKFLILIKSNLSIHVMPQGAPKSQTILRKNKVQGFILTDFKIYYKGVVDQLCGAGIGIDT